MASRCTISLRASWAQDRCGLRWRWGTGCALRRRGGKGLYQGSFRPEVLGAKDVAAAIAFGLSKEWEGLSTTIEDAWRKAAEPLEEKYRSDSWNKRR